MSNLIKIQKIKIEHNVETFQPQYKLELVIPIEVLSDVKVHHGDEDIPELIGTAILECIKSFVPYKPDELAFDKEYLQALCKDNNLILVWTPCFVDLQGEARACLTWGLDEYIPRDEYENLKARGELDTRIYEILRAATSNLDYLYAISAMYDGSREGYYFKMRGYSST